METHNSAALDEGSEFPSMSLAELSEFVAGHSWRFAKSMPKHPHEYIVRKNVAAEEAFCRFVVTIRRFGIDEPFYTKTHRYLDLGGRKYWTMGYALATTIIVNRANITHEPRPFVLNPTPFVALPDPVSPTNPTNQHP